MLRRPAPRSKIDPAAVPQHLDPVAAAEWQRLARELGDRATGADVNLLTAAAVAYARWRSAEASIAETGGPIVRQPTGLPGLNPWIVVANAALRQLVEIGRELGLSPASRGELRSAT